MGDHSFPPGTVFGPDGQPGLLVAPPSPPDVGKPASQEPGFEEAEALSPLRLVGRAALTTASAPTATLTKVLNVVRSQLGYTEGPNNSTIYGQWYGWNNVAYCAIGQTWTFAMAGGLPQIDGVRGSAWSYCPYWVAHWKTLGRWHDWTETPRPGDIVFYNWSGTHGIADHVGIVESVDTTAASTPVIISLEYNTTSGAAGSQSDGGGVYRRRRSQLYVVGYGRPSYAPQGPPVPVKPRKLVPLTIDGDWGPATTKHLQVWLNVPADGVIGRLTRRRLQEALGLDADGVWGPATHRALQHRLGVPADGVWGPITVKALQRFLNRTV